MRRAWRATGRQVASGDPGVAQGRRSAGGSGGTTAALLRARGRSAHHGTHDVGRARRGLGDGPQFIGRGGEAEQLQLVEASGSRVKDSNGREYIDLVMGWCVGNLGWAHPRIVERLRAFQGPTYVAPSFLYEPWAELGRRLAAITPGDLETCYRTTGGTEAVELAIQISMAATGRRKLVSIEGAYHGNSIAAKSVGDSEQLDSWGRTLRGCKRIAPPLDQDKLARVERLLRHDDVAAFILEPVITALGVLVPERAFMRGLQELCREHGTLLVLDEVATGFGRTGELFGANLFDLEPDVMCMAKAITSGFAPLGATIVTKEVAARVEGRFDFYSTFGWHPYAVEAALGTLDVFESEGRRLLDDVASRSDVIESRLRAMDFGCDAEVRVQGLAIGIDLDDEERPKAVQQACREAGLLISAEEEHLRLFPALTIDEATLKEAMDLLESCL
jgi:acetylornithine/succinyldiaminopimelate/putrescine aminotransferase